MIAHDSNFITSMDFFIGGAFKRKKSKMTPYKKSAPPKYWHTISKYQPILTKYGVLERFEDSLFEKNEDKIKIVFLRLCDQPKVGL